MVRQRRRYGAVIVGSRVDGSGPNNRTSSGIRYNGSRTVNMMQAKLLFAKKSLGFGVNLAGKILMSKSSCFH